MCTCVPDVLQPHYYTCIPRDLVFSRSLTLSAEIVIAPEDAEVSAGNTVIFVCVGLSSPLPDMSWSHNGVPLSNDTDSATTVYTETVEQNGMTFVMATLELCSVSVNDSGLYTCKASEGGDSTTVYFTLSVLGESKLA